MTNTSKQIKKFWDDQAVSKPEGKLVTHRDVDQVALEQDLIYSSLKEDDVLLDVGCGTGFSTSVYSKKCKRVLGVDYSIKMVESARIAYQANNLSFEHCDIQNLDDQFGKFTTAISTRCLINLSSWDEQQKAIRKIHSVLEPKGRYLMVEGTRQGREALNQLRTEVKLSKIIPVWHNKDFDEFKLKPFLEKLFEIQQDVRVGLYDVLTRVNYPLVISPKEPGYQNPFQKVARKIFTVLGNDSFPRYSRTFCLVLKKR